MSNLCCYDMRIVGEEEKVHDFLDMLVNYDRKPHFWRVFSANIHDKKSLDDGRVQVDIFGDCAWSVHSCMRSGLATYSDDHAGESTSLQEQSREKELQIEVFSAEPGMCFAEHFLYNNGEELADECVDYQEFFFEDDDWSRETFEDLQASGALSSQEVFEDWIDEDLRIGGFGDWGYSIPLQA